MLTRKDLLFRMFERSFLTSSIKEKFEIVVKANFRQNFILLRFFIHEIAMDNFDKVTFEAFLQAKLKSCTCS